MRRDSNISSNNVLKEKLKDQTSEGSRVRRRLWRPENQDFSRALPSSSSAPLTAILRKALLKMRLPRAPCLTLSCMATPGVRGRGAWLKISPESQCTGEGCWTTRRTENNETRWTKQRLVHYKNIPTKRKLTLFSMTVKAPPWQDSVLPFKSYFLEESPLCKII